MDPFGRKRKAAADDDDEAVKPRKHNDRIHGSLLMREMEGASAMRMQTRIRTECVQRIGQIILKPIMEEDMPGLLMAEHDSDFKCIVLKVGERSITKFEPYPCLTMSWDLYRFRAVANQPSDFDSAFQDLPPSPPPTTRIMESYHWETVQRLATEGISSMEDLMRIESNVRGMASVVFRDAWLLYNLRQEEDWLIPEYQMSFCKNREKMCSMNLVVHSRGSECRVSITITAPTTAVNHEGAVLLSPHVTSEYPWKFWRKRFIELEAPTTTYDHMIIRDYQTHFDVPRVIHALQVLLQP